MIDFDNIFSFDRQPHGLRRTTIILFPFADIVHYSIMSFNSTYNSNQQHDDVICIVEILVKKFIYDFFLKFPTLVAYEFDLFSV